MAKRLMQIAKAEGIQVAEVSVFKSFGETRSNNSHVTYKVDLTSLCSLNFQNSELGFRENRMALEVPFPSCMRSFKNTCVYTFKDTLDEIAERLNVERRISLSRLHYMSLSTTALQFNDVGVPLSFHLSWMRSFKKTCVYLFQNTLEEIAERSNGDMRTSLNQLQYMSLRTTALNFNDVHTRLVASAKDEALSPFTAAEK